MGTWSDPVIQSVTNLAKRPNRDEFEFTLFGPGYGESAVLHVGGGRWVIVDSCVDKDGTPRALKYLESIGVDPAEAVSLIVATHWHDDHIRGIARLVDVCSQAAFCCASVLCKKEFLTVAYALEGRSLSVGGSGLREIHRVISRLAQTGSPPKLALANRRIFVRNKCEIWSLSPSDLAFHAFLKSIGGLVSGAREGNIRVTGLSPNLVAVTLWVRVDDVTVLLGSDLEKRGWIDILQSAERPMGKASAYKVPHHGSDSGHEPRVWDCMLDTDPYALLTPWRRGGHSLPNQRDVRRILSCTPNAYATARINSIRRAPLRRSSMVERTIRDSGVKLRQLSMSPGSIRLRYSLGSSMQWKVETFGPACHLSDLN